jgi:hypothetical protein
MRDLLKTHNSGWENFSCDHVASDRVAERPSKRVDIYPNNPNNTSGRSSVNTICGGISEAKI